MDVEIVLNQHDGPGVREMDIGQVFQDVSIIDGGVAVGDFDVAPAAGGANSMSWSWRCRCARTRSRYGLRPRFIGIGVRVSAMSCFEVVRHTSG